MKKVLVLLLLFSVCAPSSGCDHTSISYLKYEKCSPRRAPEAVQVYFSRKAIPYDYKVVAKYQVRTSSLRYDSVLRKVAEKAAKHGSDAIVVDQGYGVSTTIWSWLFLFIPVTEHYKVLQVSGIRYLPAKGGRE